VTIRRKSLTVAVLAVGAVALAGCGTAGGNKNGSTESPSNLADTINIGIEQAPDSFNSNTADVNSVYNAYVDNVTQSAFYKVQPDGSVKPNPDFGTYEKTSDDPLTVKYTFSDKAVWSDGTPIDFDDALLAWAAYSGTHPSGQKAEDGSESDLFNAASTNGWAEVKQLEGKAGDKSFTMVFTKPYADWEVLGSGFMPAHIAAKQAGLSTDNDDEALVKAIQDNDTATLKKVADFWNTGWKYQADLPSLPDLALLPSSGPYKYDNASNGTLTVVKNDKWWGTPAKTDKLVFKTINPDEMVQALQNGEIDQFDPSNATTDMVTQLEGLGTAVKVEKGESLSFSHVDIDTGKGGKFADQRVREAFAKCIPRQDLVDKFAKPIFDGAQILRLHEYLPSQAEYEKVLAQVPSAKLYDTVDIAGAKTLLQQAGVPTPYKITFKFASTSQLRADQVALIKASCDQAGFDIVAAPDADVFTTLTQPGKWDAAVFGWSGSGLIAAGQSIYVTNGAQNFGRYSNTKVDDLWDQIVQVTDPADAVPLKAQMEEQLWSDLYNITLYANPGVTAYSSKLSGPVYNPTQYGSTWNAATWTKSL
jgi:peptide/nickel transport system substrate-binding protein